MKVSVFGLGDVQRAARRAEVEVNAVSVPLVTLDERLIGHGSHIVDLAGTDGLRDNGAASYEGMCW